MHIVKYRVSLLSAVQKRLNRSRQFRMLSLVGPGNMYYMGCRCSLSKDISGVSGRLESIVKHRILGTG